MDDPETAVQALSILRTGENFQWYVIALLALVIYVYANECSKKNWKGIAAGLSLYLVHWLFEILNALVQHFSGHALWTVPTGTAFLLLVGVGIELSFMFSITGLVMSKLLPEDPRLRILGINKRIFYAVANAALFSVIEIFLARTPAFIWIYPWWGALPVFIAVYIPFFVISFLCHDWKPQVQKKVIISLGLVDLVMVILFAGILHWI